MRLLLLLLTITTSLGCSYNFLDPVITSLCIRSPFTCDIELSNPPEYLQVKMKEFEIYVNEVMGFKGYKIKGFRLANHLQWDDRKDKVNAVCLEESRVIIIREDFINNIGLSVTMYHELLHCMYNLGHIENTIMDMHLGRIYGAVTRLGFEGAILEVKPYIRR